jgi:hypothetical protein
MGMADFPGGRTFRTLLALAVLAGILLGAWEALGVWQHETQQTARRGFRSLQQLENAYARVTAGQTRASQLAHAGFDVAAPGAHSLSYLGVVERFLPRDSLQFDRLDPAVRSCFEARDGCTAYIFRLGGKPDAARDTAGLFVPAAFAKPTMAEVTLLIRDGRVTYKTISGLPARDAQIKQDTAQD